MPSGPSARPTRVRAGAIELSGQLGGNLLASQDGDLKAVCPCFAWPEVLEQSGFTPNLLYRTPLCPDPSSMPGAIANGFVQKGLDVCERRSRDDPVARRDAHAAVLL